jgi:hypothetical protein
MAFIGHRIAPYTDGCCPVKVEGKRLVNANEARNDYSQRPLAHGHALSSDMGLPVGNFIVIVKKRSSPREWVGL